VFPAYFRSVPHQRSNLVQALSLHRQLAAEGAAVDKAGPRQPFSLKGWDVTAQGNALGQRMRIQPCVYFFKP